MDYTRLLLSVCVLAANILWVGCILPPNPTAEGSKRNDAKDHFHIAIIGSSGVRYVTWIAHAIPSVIWAVLIYTYPAPPEALCPQPSFARLSEPNMFTWNTKLAVILAVMAIAAAIRIAAFRNLGMDFTFNLKRPSGLVKTGIHRYVQHPSYTGIIPMICGILYFHIRFDGVAACYLTPEWVDWLVPFQPLLLMTAAAILAGGVLTRVADEEKMLKQAFGKEWEDYHRKTKRFIPGAF